MTLCPDCGQPEHQAGHFCLVTAGLDAATERVQQAMDHADRVCRHVMHRHGWQVSVVDVARLILDEAARPERGGR